VALDLFNRLFRKHTGIENGIPGSHKGRQEITRDRSPVKREYWDTLEQEVCKVQVIFTSKGSANREAAVSSKKLIYHHIIWFDPFTN
jgi:hypothetical protein